MVSVLVGPRRATRSSWCTRTTSPGSVRAAPRYHLACRPRPPARAAPDRSGPGCDGPTRPVLVRPRDRFFRRLAGDGRVDACTTTVPGAAPPRRHRCRSRCRAAAAAAALRLRVPARSTGRSAGCRLAAPAGLRGARCAPTSPVDGARTSPAGPGCPRAAPARSSGVPACRTGRSAGWPARRTGRSTGVGALGTKAPAWRRTARATVTGCGRERARAGRSSPTGTRPGGGWVSGCASWA